MLDNRDYIFVYNSLCSSVGVKQITSMTTCSGPIQNIKKIIFRSELI